MAASAERRLIKGLVRAAGSGFGATWETTEFFFKDDAIPKFINASSYRLARRVGGFTRKTAQRSIRKSKARYRSIKSMPPAVKANYLARRRAWHRSGQAFPEPLAPFRPSRPGKPPRSRTGILRDNIGFEAVKGRRGWGMVAGPRRLRAGNSANWGEAPRLHEHGGAGLTGGGKRANYPARPYMRPALKKAIKRIPQFIREL